MGTSATCIKHIGNIEEILVTFKLCPKGAQTCALPLFCDRDLEINPMTLKLEGDLYILKMYPHAENEADSSRHSIEKNTKFAAVTSTLGHDLETEPWPRYSEDVSPYRK